MLVDAILCQSSTSSSTYRAFMVAVALGYSSSPVPAESTSNVHLTYNTRPNRLTQDKLLRLAAKYPPPQSWYDEDFSGLF
jgi:hypothetical protein